MYILKEYEEILQHCTTIIEFTCNNQIGHGTGFFLKTYNKILLITNKHVVEETNIIKTYITINDNGVFKNCTYEFDIADIIYPHSNYDVCAIDFTEIYEDMVKDKEIPQNMFLGN